MSDAAYEGGDPVCWLDQVCAGCGRLRAGRGPGACEHCGAVPGAGDRPAGLAVQRRPGRDRDAAGRARNGRPRDGLGRPLPYGAQGVMRQPEGVRRSPEETLTEAQRLLDAGRPFHAHEVIEDRWKTCPAAERPLWRALAQLAVGVTHAARGNTVGAASLVARAADGLAAYEESPPYGIDVAGLLRWTRTRSVPGDSPDGSSAAEICLRTQAG